VRGWRNRRDRMTLKEFEEAKAGKSLYEYQKWFDERAWFAVDIGGIAQPCLKLTSRKVALRDGSIYVNDKDKEIRRLEDPEKRALRYRYEMMQAYDEIDTMDKVSLREYIDLLKRKSAMERELKRQEDFPAGIVYCSFCGKSKDEVEKMIVGPKNVFICCECVDLCEEILEEELDNGGNEGD